MMTIDQLEATPPHTVVGVNGYRDQFLKQIALQLAALNEKLKLNMDNPRYSFRVVEGMNRD